MKIQCLPRKWFEEIKGTVREMEVLARSEVVSIQSRNGSDSELPSKCRCRFSGAKVVS